MIARFLVSRRILLRSSYDLHYFLGTSGMEAPSLAMLSLQLLSHLAFSHQNRVEIQRGYPGEWSWVKWIMEHCAPERSELVATASTNESQGLAWENASLATMSLARFCAEKGNEVHFQTWSTRLSRLLTCSACQQLWRSMFRHRVNSCFHFSLVFR